MNTQDSETPTVQETRFGELVIAWDPRVLRPREWTAQQSAWAAELLETAAPGPVLELCSGAGQIGLLAVLRSDRALVCVDANPVAAAYTARNASAAGLGERVDVRGGFIDEVLRSDERFPLVIADPPWVRRARIDAFPDDPTLAIDGGDDGMDVVRVCLQAIDRHLADGGAALLQLGDLAQARLVDGELDGHHLTAGEVREFDRGVVLRLDRAG